VKKSVGNATPGKRVIGVKKTHLEDQAHTNKRGKKHVNIAFQWHIIYYISVEMHIYTSTHLNH